MAANLDGLNPESLDALLETLIDKHGLTHIVCTLSVLCAEKAEHVRTNWQDKALARAWDVDAKTLDKAARLICSDSGEGR